LAFNIGYKQLLIGKEKGDPSLRNNLKRRDVRCKM